MPQNRENQMYHDQPNYHFMVANDHIDLVPVDQGRSRSSYQPGQGHSDNTMWVTHALWISIPRIIFKNAALWYVCWLD